MKYLLITLGTLTLAATLATVGLVLFGQPTAGAILATATAFLWLALLVIGTVAVTTWWSASLMERGAILALRSQESDDRRDVAQVQALAQMVKVLLRQTQPQYPALPLPSQQADDWLPELAEFDVIDGEVRP